jgi:hypothetical protein
MKKKCTSQSASFNLCVLIGLFVVLAGVFLALLDFGAFSNVFAQARGTKSAPNVTQGERIAPQSRDQGTGQDFWAQTNGPQGGDGIALATNASGHVFVGTQAGGVEEVQCGWLTDKYGLSGRWCRTSGTSGARMRPGCNG